MTETDHSWVPATEDVATEAAVLLRVLDLHPVLATPAELIRELAGEPADFAQRDAIERAIRDLTGAGLLHRQESLLAPTRAALRCSELLDR